MAGDALALCGGCRVGAGAAGHDLLRLYRRLLVQAAGAELVSLGLPLTQEFRGRRTEADDAVLIHVGLRSDLEGRRWVVTGCDAGTEARSTGLSRRVSQW